MHTVQNSKKHKRVSGVPVNFPLTLFSRKFLFSKAAIFNPVHLIGQKKKKKYIILTHSHETALVALAVVICFYLTI